MDVRATVKLNLFSVSFILNEMSQRANQFCFTNRLKARRPAVYVWINFTFVPVCDCLKVIALVRGMGSHLEHCTKQNKENYQTKLHMKQDSGNVSKRYVGDHCPL